jgi:hypothetical protein
MRMFHLVFVQLALIALASFVDIYFSLTSTAFANLSPTPPALILAFTFTLGCLIVGAMREQSEKINKLQAEIAELQKKD